MALTFILKEVTVGETLEDIEAKNLLNKFLGSQVILAGMESHVSHPAKTVRKTTKVTTSTVSKFKFESFKYYFFLFVHYFYIKISTS